MRPLRGDERGAIAVIVGFLLVSMVGFGALAVDVGALVQERRTLQNGADAAALAVAKDCALGVTCGDYDGTAEDYAGLNADDGASDIEEICGTGLVPPVTCTETPTVPAGTEYVKVKTRTREAGGGSQITPFLAQVLIPGYTGTTVEMSAVAAWGTIGSAGDAVPLIFSKCEYDQYVATQPLQDGPPFTGPRSVIDFHHDDPSCGAGASGADLPGGFGFLDAADCSIDLDAGDWVDRGPGNAISGTGCDAADWELKKILIAVYDDYKLPPDPEYHIIGFASLYVTGYRFTGLGGGSWGDACSAPQTCIAGYFTKFIAVGEPFCQPPTPCADFGVAVVKMVG